MNSNSKNDPNKQTLYDLYIKQNLSKSQIKKLLKLSNKKLTDLLQKYGIKKSPEQINQNISRKLLGHPATSKKKPSIPYERLKHLYKDKHMSPEQIAQLENRSSRGVREMINRVGLTKTSKEKQQDRIYRSQQKYGVDHVAQTQEWKQKHYETMKTNNTFNSSQPEEDVYAILVRKFGKKNVLRQYKSSLYPFNCDFYIKSLDLYIEYQGSWTHYCEPFNMWNYRHLNQLREWKRQSQFSSYYKEAIKTWTLRDPLKREIAKKNHLRWAEFFTIEELLKWIND